MKKIFKYVALIVLVLIPAVAYGYSDPINISGLTGYIFTPSAYIQPEKKIVAGTAITNEYKNIFISSVIFPGLEAGLSYDFDNNRNKLFNLKYQFLPETKALPAIAFGGNINGNSPFHGAFVVISKYFDTPIPQTITAGYGTGFYDGFFVGNEILIHPKVTFMTEYIEPDRTKLENLNIRPAIHTNFGIKLMPLNNLQINIYYNFGREAGINLNYSLKF
ncbi:YjbH domain-containing protein [Desulfurobacterium sp.]